MINLTKGILSVKGIVQVNNLLKQFNLLKLQQNHMEGKFKQQTSDEYCSTHFNYISSMPKSHTNNSYFFSTLSNNKIKKTSFEKVSTASSQNNPQFQQKSQQDKIILQDLQNFISQLQKTHQTDPQNYQKISSTIDQYINQKIFAFNLKKPQDSQSIAYFFQNESLLQNYSTALNIKSSVEFRFRKYDEILTNLENELYMLKFLKVESILHKRIQKLCCKYIFALIFNDHFKLRQILGNNYSQEQNINLQTFKDEPKTGGRKASRKFYNGPKQKSQQDLENEGQQSKMKASETSLFRALKTYMKSQNPSCLLSRAIAYSVIGEVQKSLSTFCQLLNVDRKNKVFLGSFLSVCIYFGNQNFVISEGKNYSSEGIREFVKTLSTKKEILFSNKDLPNTISPQDAQYLVNSVLGYIKDEPLEWTDLPFKELQQFCHSIYLIAENYYLSGEKQKAIKIIEQLKNKINNNQKIKLVDQNQRKGRKLAQKSKTQITQKTLTKQKPSQVLNLQMLIQFFQLMRFYDQKDFDKIKEIESNFFTQQKKTFYEFHSVLNDILRSNIYQIFSQTYRDLKNNQKADEYEQLSIGNHCVNNSYEINQIQDINSQINQNIDNIKEMPKKRNQGIPPHYLNLSQQLKNFQVRFV